MMRSGRYVRAVAVLGAAALVAASCGGDDDGATPSIDETTETTASSGAGDDDGGTDTTAAEMTDTTEAGTDGDGDGAEPMACASEGGEITYGVRNEPVGFDPLVSGTTGSFGGTERNAFYDTLTRYNPESGEFEPRLAASIEPNDDLTEWTMILREGLTFGSGNPLTAEAVQVNIDRHRADDTISLFKTQAQVIETIEVVDELTLVFSLAFPWGNFPSMFAGGVGMIVDPAVLDEQGEEYGNDPMGGGAGAYTLQQWRPGEEIVFTAKDDYWNGDVCLDTFRVVPINENVARYEAFVNGEIDAAYLRSPAEIADARANDYPLQTFTSNGGLMLMINNRADRPGSDLRVRQAIAYAIDPAIVDQRLFDGQGLPGSALVPEVSSLYTDAIEGTPYDPERAAELLEEAMADGYDGSLHLVCNDVYNDAAIAIMGLLDAVGFTVENDSSRTIGDWVNVMSGPNPDYDITCHSLSMTDTQPWATLQARINTGADGQMGFVNDDMQAALENLAAAFTLEEQQTAMVEVQRVWNETVPSVIYAHVEEGVVWHENIEGTQFTIEAMVLTDKLSRAG